MFRSSTLCVLALCTGLQADWRMLNPHDNRQTRPPENIPGDAKPIKPGDKWENPDKFRWIIDDVVIPETIEKKDAKDQVVALRINGGDGGEIWVDGKLSGRFDNDHPGLAIVARKAQPGQKARVAIQFYAKVQGGEEFGEANWAIIDEPRMQPLALRVDTAKPGDPVPHGIAGLSQGGGLADYEDATAKKLKEGGFRWFRMDNILTNALKKNDGGEYIYDWSDFDKRADFIVGKMGADAIFAVSYMPHVLDAVKNDERQSAPKDYKVWEELCYNAAKRCIDRGVRVKYWEVWNEVNTGWLKPGPEDKGREPYKPLYTQALGREQTEEEVNRRFEAYCKLYEATARGVKRADPDAQIGGPALASGPFENKDCGHCFHGQGFAKGLMLFCQQKQLPLDFVSWHEYFQPPEVFIREVDAFRAYMKDVPGIEKSVKSYMITEWNEAWWADRPQDHELGAAWSANTLTRACIPHKIDRPCFFYVKQSDMNFRGDYSLLMEKNTPKAVYNVLKMFNHLSGKWLPVTGGDDDISGVACWDEKANRLAVILVNFRDRYSLERTVKLEIPGLPKTLEGGTWREWTIDATHSNVWNDRDHAELEKTREGKLNAGTLKWQAHLPANSVVLIEAVRPE